MLVAPLLLFVFGTVVAVPVDEFDYLANNRDSKLNEERSNNHIIPSGLPSYKSVQVNWSKFVNPIEELKRDILKIKSEVSLEHITKGITFNIFDENIRNATISLYYMLRNMYESNNEETEILNNTKVEEINEDVLQYVCRLLKLYNNKCNAIQNRPIFLAKPNYFVNQETIVKALKIKLNKNNLHVYENDPTIDQVKSPNIIALNTNYSGWQLHSEKLNDIKYFTEDVSLNSYYYGVHILHPYWMSNSDLDEFNPRHAEHYYFTHKQLMSRYLLERNLNGELKDHEWEMDQFYNPQLIHDNGLPFPTRYSVYGISKHEVDTLIMRLTKLNIVLEELLSRGIVPLNRFNGTSNSVHYYSINEENYMDLLPRVVREFFDGIEIANAVRSIFGNGINLDKFFDRYHPAPSVLHNPATCLRDPAYWSLMKRALNFITAYLNDLDLPEFSQYEDQNFSIIGMEHSNLTTFFDNYQFVIDKSDDIFITGRQKRLAHIPFEINISVDSRVDSFVTVRIFIGPSCEEEECPSLANSNKFFQLDVFKTEVIKGHNLITWISKNDHFSFDNKFNLEYMSPISLDYNSFKFPNNLLLPKGFKDGVNVKLFVMVTPANAIDEVSSAPDNSYYKKVYYELDDRPLGFPFHRPHKGSIIPSSNYKFYDAQIYHIDRPDDETLKTMLANHL